MKKIIILIFIICTIIFLCFAYKKNILGNNINKSDYNNILNISAYEAIAEVEIYSNKNTNRYVLKQMYFEPNIFKQEVIEPENLKGFTITFDGTNLNLEHRSLELQKKIIDYSSMQGNSLSLISFIEEYKNNPNNEEEETQNEKILKLKINNSKNKYVMYKKLYINKNNNLPSKMEILDINQNRTVYILYREIKINKTSKEDVLAK